VDDLVERVVNAVETIGALDHTVFIFTSANGFFHGEHRIKREKVAVYEEASRVPLIIRGGGFPSGATATQLTVNVDLAPTIVALAGAVPGLVTDGRDLLPLALDGGRGQGRAILIETWFVRGFLSQWYSAVRTECYVWVEHSTGETELYDLRRDPYQLQSRHNDSRYWFTRLKLQNRLARLRTCAGSRCDQGTD
jgi:arylsulfatase A-like enzyme